MPCFLDDSNVRLTNHAFPSREIIIPSPACALKEQLGQMLFIFPLNGEEGRRDGEGQARAESWLAIHSCADRLQNLR